MPKVVRIVWFKRDLRIEDHEPLALAAEGATVLPVWIWEPSVLGAATASARQFRFASECLDELREDLARLGLRLFETRGEAVGVFDRLVREYAALGLKVESLWSHEETGEEVTYARDRAVAAWARERGVVWREFRQQGVFRRLASRDGRDKLWETFVSTPVPPTPPRIEPAPRPLRVAEGRPDIAEDAPGRQRGGRLRAVAVLDDFLRRRAGFYRGGISSPLSATSACSRISPYLAWGAVSLRETVNATRRASAAREDSRLTRGLAAFESRLHWHCHFIQKLESQPDIEIVNVNHGFDGMRENDFDEARFTAWRRGETGYPMVDACMACLRETGWINFRMRAMLMSFAAYTLWLHWRRPGIVLARLFTDFDPGIHWPQIQMQSGVTGINVPRMYDPVLQAVTHDPKGEFVRRWLPALRRVPDAWVFEPWRMPEGIADFRPGVDYPLPVVEFRPAMAEARRRYAEWFRSSPVLMRAAEVYRKHGSRKRPSSGARSGTAKPAGPAQLGFDF